MKIINNFNILDRILLGNKQNKNFRFFDLFSFIYNSYNNFFLSLNGRFCLNSILSKIFPIKIKGLDLFINHCGFKFNKPMNNFHYCIENGLSYSSNLKFKFCISNYNSKDFYNCQYIVINNFPILTNNASFVINGIERTIISKFTRAPGFYYIIINKGNKKNYSIKIIPDKGKEVLFFIDSNNFLFLKVLDYKLSIIYILRFLGLSVVDIINNFYEFEYIHFINDCFFLKIFYDYFVNFSVPYDITDSFNNVIVEKNTLLNESHIENIKSLNIEYIKITDDYLLGKVLGSDIYFDNNYIANSCEKIDNLILSKIKEFKINEFKIIHFSTTSQYCILLSILDGDMDILSINNKVIDFFSKIGFYFIKENFFNSSINVYNNISWDISGIRGKINFKLNRSNPSGPCYLNLNDFLDIIRCLILFKDGLILEDDLQGLNSMSLNLIGDFYYDIFNKFFNKLQNNILNKNFFLKKKLDFFPKDFINFNDLEIIIKKFFNFSKYSQFLDQINLLSEFAHKRRVTFLGIPGVSKEHSGFDVRDLNSSYYSKLCPVETPEGINIGLVGSLSLFSLVNNNKDLLAPYHKVVNGKVISRSVIYLSSMDESGFIFTDSSDIILPNNYLKNSLINVRCDNQIILSKSKFVNYIDISPYQIFSVSTCLIPFIEYNDSNRALMAANMIRQALPCLIPQRPLVGTGLERLIGTNSKYILRSKSKGVVLFIDPSLMIVEEIFKKKNFFFNYNFYYLLRHKSSNQNTDISQRFNVNLNNNISTDDILSDSNCTDKGELSLGQNILVAFMSWGGYNFEDSIIVSERILHEDRFTSLENFSLDINVLENEDFYEILSHDIKSNHNLNNFGIIKIGSLVSSFDLLIGKKTFYYKKKPQNVINEIKVLDSIFKKKEEDFVDSSFYLPSGFNLAEVSDIKIYFSSNIKLNNYDDLLLNYEFSKILKKKKKTFIFFYSKFIKKLKNFLFNEEFLDSNNNIYKIDKDILFKMNLKKISSLILNNKKKHIIFKKFYINIEKYLNDYKSIRKNLFNNFFKNLPVGVSKLIKIYFIRKKKLQVGDKMSGRHGNKGVISKILPICDMPYMSCGKSIDMILNPLGVPSRMNLGQLMEVHLGFISFLIQIRLSYYLFSKNIFFLKKFLVDIFNLLNYKFSLKIKDYSKKKIISLSKYFLKGFYFGVSAFNTFKENDLNKLYKLVMLDFNFIQLSNDKKQVYLYDGRSGLKFENSVTVGYMYILKLNHLSQDKLHSRSVGSYSLITQQPLKGKSNTGGQRVGEMEVWAFEAYGASYTLRDMLTIKSDDILGRFILYKNIINDGFKNNYNLPESFYVMLNNINSMGIYVRFIK